MAERFDRGNRGGGGDANRHAITEASPHPADDEAADDKAVESADHQSPDEYIRPGATRFECGGVTYGYTLDGSDLYVDGPRNSTPYDSCYIVRSDGVVDGDDGAVVIGQEPEWVREAVKKAKEEGKW